MKDYRICPIDERKMIRVDQVEGESYSCLECGFSYRTSSNDVHERVLVYLSELKRERKSLDENLGDIPRKIERIYRILSLAEERGLVSSL